MSVEVSWQEVEKMVQEMGIAGTARELDISAPTLYVYMRKKEELRYLIGKSRVTKIAQIPKEEFVKRYTSCKTNKEVREQFGCSRQALWVLAGKYGCRIDRRKGNAGRPKRPKVRKTKIIIK